jgi:glutamyl-Q tRNA(Asp) synthetase
VRLRVADELIEFSDLIQGFQQANLSRSTGDFVIRRADGLAAYQLAVVLDDACQGVTEVIRGADLLDSTARQIHLQRSLGLSTPVYAHHPVAAGKDGVKLSKRLASDPIASSRPEQVLECALRFLGQPCPSGLDQAGLLNWALENWQLSRIPRTAFTL